MGAGARGARTERSQCVCFRSHPSDQHWWSWQSSALTPPSPRLLLPGVSPPASRILRRATDWWLDRPAAGFVVHGARSVRRSGRRHEARPRHHWGVGRAAKRLSAPASSSDQAAPADDAPGTARPQARCRSEAPATSVLPSRIAPGARHRAPSVQALRAPAAATAGPCAQGRAGRMRWLA